MTKAKIDAQRLLGRLDAFAAIGATQGGGVNRQALSQEDRRARQLLTELAQARGFTVYQDAIANLFVRRTGKDSSHAPFLMGSHLDSQITGGRFDGVLGTLAAFEVLEALEDAGIETPIAVEAVAWMNEEGCRYQPGCMGSMAFASGSIMPRMRLSSSLCARTAARVLWLNPRISRPEMRSGGPVPGAAATM